MHKQNLDMQKNVYRVIFAGLLALIVASGLAAKALFAQRDFSGNIKLELCQADANGKWKIIDTAEAPASFSASVTELASGNEVMSRVVWNTTSAKGRRISVRLARAGKSSFDLKTGKLELMQMPFEVTVDGQKEMITYNLTTESTAGADGMISGKRAQVSNGTASLGVVGAAKLRTDKLATKGQATVGNIKKVEDFLVVIKANGQLVAR